MLLIAVVIAAALAAGRVVQRRRPETTPLLVQRILAVMITVLVPIVTFFNVAHLEFDRDVLGGIALGIVALVLTGTIGALAGPRLLGLDRPSTGALMNAGLQPNSGYLGLPIVGVLLGSDDITVAVGYDALVVAPVLIIGVFGVAAAYGTKAGATRRERLRSFVVRNPPLIAAALGLLAPRSFSPDVAVDASRVIIYAQLPLGLFAVGAILTAQGLRIPPPLSRPVVAALALRSVVAPLILLALAAPLIDLPTSYLVLAAMAPGLTGVGIADRFGLDVPLQAGAVAWGTAVVVSAGVVLELAT
jgi:predicted permease